MVLIPHVELLSPIIQKGNSAMSQQRFYPYTPVSGETLFCEHAGCAYLAVWWDAIHDVVCCDLHALAEVITPARVQDEEVNHDV